MRIAWWLAAAVAVVVLAGCGHAAGDVVTVADKVVTITQVPGMNPLTGKPAAASWRPVTVTGPAKVARIAAVVDGLPLFPPGTWSCPNDTGQGIKLTFRAWLRGPVLAVVSGDDGGCGGVSVTVGGRSMPALWHGAQLQQQVLAIAGRLLIGRGRVAVWTAPATWNASTRTTRCSATRRRQ